MLKLLLDVFFSGSSQVKDKKNDASFTPFTHQNLETGKFGAGVESGDVKLPK